MKKNKKGFTLIELLAVIVILGIIITIVVSNVVKYINQARTGSYVDAYQIILKDLRTQLLANEMNKGTATLTECDDVTGSTKCSNEYKGLYDSKNIKMRIKKNTTSGGYDISVAPTSDGSFSGVDLTSTSINNAAMKNKTLGSTMDTSGEISKNTSVTELE